MKSLLIALCVPYFIFQADLNATYLQFERKPVPGGTYGTWRITLSSSSICSPKSPPHGVPFQECSYQIPDKQYLYRVRVSKNQVNWSGWTEEPNIRCEGVGLGCPCPLFATVGPCP